MIQRIPSRYLTAYVILADIGLVLIALPLQRYALGAALSPSTGASLILLLLFVNALLLLVVVAAALASCGLLMRLAVFAARHLRRHQ